MHPIRSAFTLIEVLVAITIGAIVLLGARDVMGQLADAVHRLRLQATTLERTANSERDLRDVMANVEVGVPGSEPFVGNADSAIFSAWCGMPGGWVERCSVALTIESAVVDSGYARWSLLARFGGRRDLVFTRVARSVRLLYLNSAAYGGQWYTRWTAGIRAPLAIGIVMDRDTMFVRVGGVP